MSEYQYYEFQALDRPLTQTQMDELRDYSTRARITPRSFLNVYNWGDFKGDPYKWMEKYFDAFLYMANWGTRRLMFRVPVRLLNPNTASAYCNGETVSFWTAGDHLILGFYSQEVEEAWVEGEGWLDSLSPLRSDLMHGDYRCLYLGWLRAIREDYLGDEDMEPPVPPGLATLNAPLQSLAEFLDVDHDLISAAAENSDGEPPGNLSKEDIASWVATLPSKDKNAILTRLVEDDALHIAVELKQRALSEIRSERNSESPPRKSGQRSVGQLIARAEVISEERRRLEAERRAREKARREREQAKKRGKYLQSLVGKESVVWTKVDRLIAGRQPKGYDEAVSLLEDLRDLAEMEGKSPEFAQRMSALYCEHARKPSLIKRFHKAGLPDESRPILT